MQHSGVRFAKLKLSTSSAPDVRIGYSRKNRLALIGNKRRTIMTKSQNLSTGPTSEEGKAISCQNSTKHGLTSVKLNTQEEQSLYDAMVASLTEELNPQGMTEENLVSDMAMIRIRLNRFDRTENALFFIEQDQKATPKLLHAMGIDDYGLRSEISQ